MLSKAGLVPFKDSNKYDINSNNSSYQDQSNLELSCLSHDDCKQEFLSFINLNRCYSKFIENDLHITRLESFKIEKYCLTTFTETRTIAKAYVPYDETLNQNISTKQDCILPWDYEIQPKELFHSQIVIKEMTNSSHIKDCFDCEGKGYKVCVECDGNGKKECNRYHEENSIAAFGYWLRVKPHWLINYDNMESLYFSSIEPYYCIECSNNGYFKCDKCYKGKRICSTCNSKKKLRWFYQIVSCFESHKERCFVKPNLNLPDKFLKNCRSKLIFSEEANRVYPIRSNKVSHVDKLSHDLISFHSEKFSNSRILAQKQEVFYLPISKCFYKIKGTKKESYFYVCGVDRVVYAPEYSSDDVWCSII